MSEWREVTLGDAPIEILDGDRGKNYPKKHEFTGNGSCLFLNTKNVTSSGFNFAELNFITKEKDEILRKGRLERNDVILTTRGTVGNVAFYDKGIDFDNVRINSGMVIIRPIGLDPNFNYHLFKFLTLDLSEFISGSAQPQLPIRDLKQITVKLPLLPEQKAIAEVFSSLDDKIALLHRQNKTLEQMAETLFRQWFVEEAKEDWEERPLNELVDVAIGRTPPRKESQWFSTNTKDVKWISIKDMGNDGTFIFNTAEYLTKDAVEEYNIPIIPKNTVVLSFKMTLGRVGITSEEMLSNEAIAHFKFNKETPFTKEYLYLFLKSYPYETLGSTSSIVTSINSTMIKEMIILVPDEDKIEDFKIITKNSFNKIK